MSFARPVDASHGPLTHPIHHLLRFAAKEAVIKAHPHRSLTWHEIVITSRPSSTTTPTPPDNNNNRTTGAPTAIIRGATEDYEALLSISHDGEYATAVCLGAPET